MIKNKNFIDIYSKAIGNERRLEMYHEVVDRGTFLPKTVLYEDIDDSFREWVKRDISLVSDEGTEFPTMTLYSSQRFSEYSQTWEYVDSNNNLMLNFKTVSRDINPQKGEFNGNIYNIPGDRYYTIREGKVLDDNGSESILRTRMKLPTPVNFIFHVSVFTNKYDKVNEFNTIVNKLFASRQCYISPNGHYMPMVIDSIDDKTEYNIDDRQFYGQTINVKVLGYVITEDDYLVEEVPYKLGANIDGFNNKKRRKAYVEIEDEECPETGEDSKYYYKPINLTISFPKCITKSEFTIDTDFNVDEWETDNVRKSFSMYVNGETVTLEKGLSLNEGDRIKFKIKAFMPNETAMIKIRGHNENEVFNSDNDDDGNEVDDYVITNEET